MSCGTYPFRYVNATTSGAAQWPSSTVNMQVKETINRSERDPVPARRPPRPHPELAKGPSGDTSGTASPGHLPGHLPLARGPDPRGCQGPDLAGDAVPALAHTGGNQAARAGESTRECWRRPGAGRLWP